MAGHRFFFLLGQNVSLIYDSKRAYQIGVLAALIEIYPIVSLRTRRWSEWTTKQLPTEDGGELGECRRPLISAHLSSAPLRVTKEHIIVHIRAHLFPQNVDDVRCRCGHSTGNRCVSNRFRWQFENISFPNCSVVLFARSPAQQHSKI